MQLTGYLVLVDHEGLEVSSRAAAAVTLLSAPGDPPLVRVDSPDDVHLTVERGGATEWVVFVAGERLVAGPLRSYAAEGETVRVMFGPSSI